jgi:uncharacterized phage protein (TIGR02220 family)
MAEINDNNYLVIQSFMVKDLQLKGNELLVYACIFGFSQNGDGYRGGISYLKSWIGSSKNTVMNVLKSLESKGYITKEEVLKNNIKFCIYYAKLDVIGVVQNFDQGCKNLTTSQKIAPNNIYNNNISNTETNNNIINSNDNKNNINKTIIDNIIIYLNSILGAKFGLGTQNTRNLISKWLKAGFTEDDFKTVIDKKYAEWHNTNMEMYLRPSTLFGNKFEEYLNQKKTNNSNHSQGVDIVDNWV